MTDKAEYNAKDYALSLGFSDEDAEAMGKVNADATNIRRVAEAKGITPAAKADSQGEAVTKQHQHSYRKDGTCACGRVKRERKSKS